MLDYDVVVIGGGVVGLAVLREATLKGYRCALVEKERDLLSWASGSNSGIACTGVDAAPGSLERALIRDSISRFRIYCREMNIPIKNCGSIVCSWPWDENDCLNKVLQESHVAGDIHARWLSTNEILREEPNLNPDCRGGVFIPGEIVVDPWLYSISLAVHARVNGAEIFTDWEFDPIESKVDNIGWTIIRKCSEQGSCKLRSRVVINCTGAWSDIVQKGVEDESKWETRPRRGQYVCFRCNQTTRINHPIQPVPTEHTKGIFVFSSIYDQIFVGPTAMDQESREDRNIEPSVREILKKIAVRVIPTIDVERDFVGEYVGIRPGTTKRDYQIHANYDRKCLVAAGIRSTGLTASLGIGKHVVHLLSVLLPNPETPLRALKAPLPNVADLMKDYTSRKDDMVHIHGYDYKVTHPITRFGWSQSQP